jgi:hypothetical protein
MEDRPENDLVGSFVCGSSKSSRARSQVQAWPSMASAPVRAAANATRGALDFRQWPEDADHNLLGRK